jgi:hypothetical protein
MESGSVVAGGGMLASPEKHAALTDRLLSDPFSAATDKRRAHLMFTACFSILLSVYGLEVTKTPWLDFNIPSGAPNILHGALSLALIYTFLVFAIFAWQDVGRWLAAGDLLYLDAIADRLRNAHGQLQSLSKRLDAPSVTETPPEKWKEYVAGGFAFVNHFDDSYRTFIQRARALKRLQTVRIVVLDLGVPLTLGIFALFKISWAIGPFLATAFA